MTTQWTLKKRMTLTFAAILALAFALIATAVIKTNMLRETVKWNIHTQTVLAESDELLLYMLGIETSLRGFIEGGEKKFLESFIAGEKSFAVAFDKVKALTSDNPAQQDRLAKAMADHKAFMAVANALLEKRRGVSAGTTTLGEVLLEFSAGTDEAAMDAFRATLAEFDKVEEDLLTVRSAQLDATMSSTTTIMVGGGAVLAVLTALLGLALVRSVSRQLGADPSEAVAAVNAVAAGNLTVQISLLPGDTSSLMAALARMRDSLAKVVIEVRQNSESVATASAQIAQGNQDLSGRTEQQASALEQTAATMEQLGATVRKNADSAKQANQLAQNASTVASKGGDVVGKVVITMQDINNSSRQIGDIISVIDAIAFQTNILALNAAVEAARAGEQGRGFAVVASEVRNLAKRSADAAKEIKLLITRSVEQVEQGTSLVGQAGQTMSEIVGSIQRVTDIVAEISAASAEQSSGVSQVGEAVAQMDQATQQNAALVEESAAASASLQGQAQQLVNAVAVFKLA